MVMSQRHLGLVPSATAPTQPGNVIPLFARAKPIIEHLRHLPSNELPAALAHELQQAVLHVAMLHRPEVDNFASALDILLTENLLHTGDVVSLSTLVAVCHVSDMVTGQDVELDPGTIGMLRQQGTEFVQRLHVMYDKIFKSIAGPLDRLVPR